MGGHAPDPNTSSSAYSRHPGAAGGIRGIPKMYLPSSRWTWAFVLVSLVQALIVLGFESYVFGQFQIHSDNFQFSKDKPPASNGSTPSVEYAIPTFLALYIFGLLYQLVLVWDALRLKNTIQVIGLCLFNVALLIYAAVQSQQIHDQIQDTPPARAFWHATKPYLIAIPCILALGTCLMTVFARALYNEFAWTIYKHISADLKMKRRYLTFQVCLDNDPYRLLIPHILIHSSSL